MGHLDSEPARRGSHRWALTLASCLLAMVCASCVSEPDDPLIPPIDASFPDDASDAGDAGPVFRRDAAGIPDASRDAAPEPPRTSPCEPRRAPIACNPRRIVDDCEAFGEECTSASRACFARKPEGELCRGDGECVDGLVCTGTISYGVCAPTPGEGEPCTGVCLESDRLFCDLDASPPVCAAKRGVGGPCGTSPVACVEGLFCGAEALCTAPRPIGDACGSTIECATGLSCTAGACAAAPGVGEECVDVCEGGFFCDVTQFPAVCVPRIAEGDPCPNFGVDLALGCQDGYRCFFDTSFEGICAAPVALGGACSVDRDTCDLSLRCDGAVCAEIPPPPPGPPVGAPCEGSCVDGAYCGGVPTEIGICWSTTCGGDDA